MNDETSNGAQKVRALNDSARDNSLKMDARLTPG